MCVGLRAKVANIEDNMAVIDAGGVKRRVSAELISDLAPGDYVMVHAGLVIARIAGDDAAEADSVMEERDAN